MLVRRGRATIVLLISPTGGGITYLASAIGIAACQNWHTVAYARMDDLTRRRSSPGATESDTRSCSTNFRTLTC
ncbi:ATP-binding protein [Pseudarthrobacter sulfonivorans]|uniref:ATP-binding protein n=1 Tax=Pseudarthrobacter sulfonivorans TaxID=121292 RepID=UPI00286C5FA9|nr:ATP-binding protein [Pseudarthrobacter sulfonivorans]